MSVKIEHNNHSFFQRETLPLFLLERIKDTGWHAIPHINSSAHREFSEWIPQYSSAPCWKQHTDLHSTHKLGVTTFTTPRLPSYTIRPSHTQPIHSFIRVHTHVNILKHFPLPQLTGPSHGCEEHPQWTQSGRSGAHIHSQEAGLAFTVHWHSETGKSLESNIVESHASSLIYRVPITSNVLRQSDTNS